MRWFMVFFATAMATWAGLTVVKTFKPEAFDVICFSIPALF